jgi:hypothetical protein
VPRSFLPNSRLVFVLPAVPAVVAVVVAFSLSASYGVLIGAIALAWVGAVLARGDDRAFDPSRRRFLAALGLAGTASLVGGAAAGRALRGLTTPDPSAAIDEMARGMGSEALELVRRAYRPGRLGDLQLVLTPGSTSNYKEESLNLARRDPRSSHALPWMYAERVPIVVYAPGVLERSDHTERVTLADLAPTTARLMGFDAFVTPDGTALPGIAAPATPPRLIVTFVFDGGGWNVLQLWPDAWPNLRALMASGATYRNAITGSFPAVTAAAHATIGTGAFPRTHGITGHNIRDGQVVRKAYRRAGRADPSDILVPTLADAWTQATDQRAWVGELGWQVWHIGMLGRGGRPLGELPVGVYFDEAETHSWRPHHPTDYRLPAEVPPAEDLDGYVAAYASDPANRIDERFNPSELKSVCCNPPGTRYQGDLVKATLMSERPGFHGSTDLLYVNFKSPDYAGHTWNMESERTAIALQAVDEQLARMMAFLDGAFAPGECAVIVTADHGQCPTVEDMGGVRVDPIQLKVDLEREFGRSMLDLVAYVAPSEIYLNELALVDAGFTRDDVAAFLHDYTYEDNLGPYVRDAVVDDDRLAEPVFAAVLSTDYLARIEGADLTELGPGRYAADEDPLGLPPVTW